MGEIERKSLKKLEKVLSENLGVANFSKENFKGKGKPQLLPISHLELDVDIDALPLFPHAYPRKNDKTRYKIKPDRNQFNQTVGPSQIANHELIMKSKARGKKSSKFAFLNKDEIYEVHGVKIYDNLRCAYDELSLTDSTYGTGKSTSKRPKMGSKEDNNEDTDQGSNKNKNLYTEFKLKKDKPIQDMTNKEKILKLLKSSGYNAFKREIKVSLKLEDSSKSILTFYCFFDEYGDLDCDEDFELIEAEVIDNLKIVNGPLGEMQIGEGLNIRNEEKEKEDARVKFGEIDVFDVNRAGTNTNKNKLDKNKSNKKKVIVNL